ncbi:HlyD family type I secretion periplasmic adaptor subunit [Litorimonas sp. RW-G-Af-16]|uniref:HlyD family type I secretion periplasmic adaptor subunit n=1 Tax=Litorimonas sp. RW-G-Af-16 TaxID=3241168 RepID=UPI00390C9621
MNAQLPPDLQAQLAGLAGKNPAKPQKEPYAAYLRWGFIAIAALMIGVFGWAALAQIKGAVLAPGIVAIEGKPKLIQHLDGGIVGEILVEEGDTVAQGEVLMRLDPTQLEANREIVTLQYNETQARVYRLQAERDGLSQIVWPEALLVARSQPRVERAMDGQEKLFQARRIAIGGQISQLRERKLQLGEQINGLRALISSKESQSVKIREEAKAKRVLVDKGYLGRPAVLALEREQLRLEGDIANHQADIARLEGSIVETDQQISQLRRDRQSEVLTELRQADAEASGFLEQLMAATSKTERIDITAPVAGVIHNMQVTTIGGVVTPGQEIMQIIPSDAQLIVEAQVAPQDIDQIYQGQPTNVRLSAFNARKTPELTGRVTSVAPDRLIDPVTGYPYYVVRIEIPPEELARLNEGLTLIPGMPAESFMQTDNRSVLSYVLKPASDAMTRAGREE